MPFGDHDGLNHRFEAHDGVRRGLLPTDQFAPHGALGVDLPGELLGLLVAPDGELLALTGSAAGGGALHCVAAGDDEPTPLLILESTPTQAHLSTTGVLSVALLEGEAGRVDVFGFAGCGADPVLIWSIALSGRPLATAMGGALVLGLL
mgnify:CR=1 FL=1